MHTQALLHNNAELVRDVVSDRFIQALLTGAYSADASASVGCLRVLLETVDPLDGTPIPENQVNVVTALATVEEARASAGFTGSPGAAATTSGSSGSAGSGRRSSEPAASAKAAGRSWLPLNLVPGSAAHKEWKELMQHRYWNSVQVHPTQRLLHHCLRMRVLAACCRRSTYGCESRCQSLVDYRSLICCITDDSAIWNVKMVARGEGLGGELVGRRSADLWPR